MSGPFRGSIVALPTPFAGGEVDLVAFEGLVERQIEGGSDGLVVNGTTGEAATLTREERRLLVETCVAIASGRVPVIAGVGTNCTRTTCEEVGVAERAGVDGLLVVTPYYNRPSQAGLLLHASTVAARATKPILLYNVPARTGVDLLPRTAARIAGRCPNVVAIKEASGSIERMEELVALGKIDVLCGEDSLAAASLAAGAVGLIGVVANLVPREVAALVRACRRGGDGTRRRQLEARLNPLLGLLSVGTNPVPVKAALEHMGLAQSEVRPPLAPLDPEGLRRIHRGLEQAPVAASAAR